MTADRDPELAALLRAALAAEAERVEPAGDGLSRIRRRTAARPSWRDRWLVPGLALAGAAAVIAAVAVLPSVLPSDGGGLPAGAQTTATTRSATPSVPATSSPPTGSPTPDRTSAPVPGATVPPPTRRPTPSPPAPTRTEPAVTDLATVWPYASRAEGGERADRDVRDGVYPYLRDPGLTAVAFVGSFVGRDGLSAARLDAYPPGLRMLVSRDGRPVSTVFLVRVRAADDAPYVVVGASRADIDGPDSLTISAPPAVAGTDPLAVGGVLRRADGDPAPSVTVELREPGQDQPLARASVSVRVEGDATMTWSALLTPKRPATGGVVAAWTTDPDGGVLEFVAAPTAR